MTPLEARIDRWRRKWDRDCEDDGVPCEELRALAEGATVVRVDGVWRRVRPTWPDRNGEEADDGR